MKIFLAGASGVIGVRLLPLMAAAGHVVAAMTRSPDKVDRLRAAGALPVVCDVFDAAALELAVRDFQPDLLMHQVTDLPDELSRLPQFRPANDRVRSEGTRNLLAAARSNGVSRFIAQSIAWRGGPIIEAHERSVLEAGGTVLRYGQFYGPGTYYEHELPSAPRIHVDEAARRTMQFLSAPPGSFIIAED
jgi:nucleoside-diphosphate-sugar epimerase